MARNFVFEYNPYTHPAVVVVMRHDGMEQNDTASKAEGQLGEQCARSGG
ncbi:MAG: hypothetical protein AUK63_838 [bacterium P3]|nr:MAG: hypothetical protein AUK63_838 [bacterium P3]KWW41464.1 MAG: hypothetical protein F083_1026 [bacterium F083]